MKKLLTILNIILVTGCVSLTIAGNRTSVGNSEFLYAKGHYEILESNTLLALDNNLTGSESTGSSIPTDFALEQNYPNPFNPSTSIKFNLAADSKVTLKVYSILGQPVATLVDGFLSAGYHSVKFNASHLSSGLYMYKLEAKAVTGAMFVNTKKMILSK